MKSSSRYPCRYGSGQPKHMLNGLHILVPGLKVDAIDDEDNSRYNGEILNHARFVVIFSKI